MVKKYVRHFVCMFLAMLGMTQSASAFTDFKVQLTKSDIFDTNTNKFGVKVASDGTYSATAFDDATATFTVNAVRFNDADHGWVNCVFTIPVEGPVKIGLGNCQYGAQKGTIVDAAGNTTDLTVGNANCWHQDKENNISYTYYKGTAPTTLTVTYEGYCPFISVEALPKAEGTGFKVQLTKGDIFDTSTSKFGVKVASDGTYSATAFDDVTATFTVNAVRFNDADHGWVNCVFTIPVQGSVKIGLGNCQYGAQSGTIVDAAGNKTDLTVGNANCWHQDKENNISYTYYKGTAPTTLTVTYEGYCPFISLDPVADWEIPNDATITFDLGNMSAEGVVPADMVVELGTTFTIPLNRTLYVEGKTLTGWTDGKNTYATGEEVTAKESLTLTPVFTDNAIGFNQRSTEITAIWDFQQKNGAPVMNHQNDTGIYVTQVTIQGQTIDLKLDFDTNNGGKINNGSWQDWCQMNTGTKFTLPAAKGTAYSTESYNVTTTTTFAGSTEYTAEGNVVTYNYGGNDKSIDIVIGDGSYFRYIQAVYPAAQDKPVALDITGTWDFGNTDMQEAVMAFSGTTEAGEVEDIEKNGLKMTIEANSATFRTNGNNMQIRNGAVLKIPVRAAGDLITVKGYPGYSQYTIAGSDVLTDENTYKVKISDAEAGYVAVTSKHDNNYYYSISVVQYAPKEKATLDNEPATATFPFNEGTEDQKATLSNADYFLSSKVAHGSNWFIKDSYSYAGANGTRLEPLDQHNDNLTDDDAVSFLFTPKPGFTFTPTKVSFKANRFGTDNGLIDVYWQNADGTTVELEKEVKPERNNTNTYTDKSYDITGATAGEGTCGLKLFLYHLQANKQIGLADIIIEGVLNGTEKDVPVLASFKVNGNQYAVEDVFGELYEATLKLPKAEAMVSKSNPLTDVTATTGEVGEIIYDEQDKACTVTIPMTAGDTQMSYVLNVIYKPDYTLEYVGVDGNVLATQAVEEDAAIGAFAFDINDAPATKEGYKARGWFKQNLLGEKYTTDYVVTGDTKLYAVQTEIEEASTHKKYIFDLADKFFYAEDHEAFNPAGEGFYWHDAQHGWAFKNGNTVDLLVGPKATITVTLCQYGSGTGIAVKKGDEVLATLDGIASGDGGTTVFNYEGEPGTLTLEMQCGGEMYIHGVKIVNTAEVNFDKDGDWYFVKAGDAGSLMDVIEVVNGTNASKDAPRAYIFVPNGLYDLDATVKTAISGHNISIIGESMYGTNIVTTPDKSIEGLGKADMFQISGTNTYLQDLTLQNALDYYAAGSAGRAPVIADAGNRTIGKNVRMLSYQDTYYSSNSSQQAYWENCDIHGTVDFICGGGDIRFQNSTITLEPRALDGKGSRTIVAPTTNTKFGYVFDGCTIVDFAQGFGNWNYGRTWQNEPITVYLNTKLDANAANSPISTRWIEKGMNNKDPKLFGEFNTMDDEGNNITPASNTINSFGGSFETILTAEQASAFSYEQMFSENSENPWDPASLAKPAPAAKNVKLDGNTLSWQSELVGQFWAVVKGTNVIAFTRSNSYTVDDPNAMYAVRAVNGMGGLGEPVEMTVETVVTLAKSGYATFYDSRYSFALPEGVKAYMITAATTDALTYTQINGVVTSGVPVMLKGEKGGDIVLKSINTASAIYTGDNLLRGSDEATMTTADEDSWFYKLTFGKGNTNMANTFGWFWGAADGAAFQIEGHRAWLAIPKVGVSAPTLGYELGAGLTGITEMANGQQSTADSQFYNLNGQRVATPSKGLYIHNNKKVIVK